MGSFSARNTEARRTRSRKVRSSLHVIIGAITTREAAHGNTSISAGEELKKVVCPFCLEAGMAAANYELADLVKHIARKHPLEGLVVSVVGTILIAWAGPKIARSLSS